jgi:hypothetical protein
MAVQARFWVSEVTKQPDGSSKVILTAVTSKENARWSQYTPYGKLEMSLTRKASGALSTFEQAVDRARRDPSYKPECLVTLDFDAPPAEQPGRATDENGKDIGYATDE